MKKQLDISLPSEADASGRSLGATELDYLRRVIESGTLNCTRGTMTPELESRFAQHLGVANCRALASGTAAVHTAVAAVNPSPGDEIISTPITDMGAITPILYQSAIPVFADVDPRTYNVTAETIAPQITRRTKAVIVTHLFGNMCDMDPIIELCRQHDLVLIEDCAQAYGATYRDRPAGTMGQIGCYSLQQSKHITAGEGGFVVSDNDTLFRRMKLFVDKAWGYGDPKPDHYFLALNYRITELQSAVALAQLEKLPELVQRRVAAAEMLGEMISGVDGVHVPELTAGSTHTYWKYPLRLEAERFEGGADGFGARMKEAGVWCAPRYVQKPAFECEVLRDQRTFGDSRFPFVGPHRDGDPEIVYDRADTPGTVEALANVVVLPWNENFTEQHVQFIAHTIRDTADALRR